jgi:hypothetical protein
MTIKVYKDDRELVIQDIPEALEAVQKFGWSKKKKVVKKAKK